jgi:AmiR/NasT family two-component response regulator
VHQATGMVAEQLRITVTEALIRLRAYAFAQDRPLTDIANDVVTARLRFGQRPGDSPAP